MTVTEDSQGSHWGEIDGVAIDFPMVVEDMRQLTLTYTVPIAPARALLPGDAFEVFPPDGANWAIHHNTIAGCRAPVHLACYGSVTSRFSDNTVVRGEAEGVQCVVEVHGRFSLTGNTFSGFAAPESTVLGLFPDRLGQPPANRYVGNVFDHCAKVLTESAPGLWAAAQVDGNVYIECGAAPQ